MAFYLRRLVVIVDRVRILEQKRPERWSILHVEDRGSRSLLLRQLHNKNIRRERQRIQQGEKKSLTTWRNFDNIRIHWRPLP